MTDPGRLARKSITVAAARLGDRREACRAVVDVARAAAVNARRVESACMLDDLPLAGWLDQVVMEAERMARLAGAIE